MLEVRANERGVIRVFSISAVRGAFLQDAECPHARAELLGLKTVTPGYTEIFPLSDLGGMGLAGYLTEGYGVSVEQIEADRDRLDALSGWVMLVLSGAFNGNAAQLAPIEDLTPIGLFTEPGVDWSAEGESVSAAATEPIKTDRKRPSDAAMSGRIAMAALLFLALFTVAFVWIAS